MATNFISAAHVDRHEVLLLLLDLYAKCITYGKLIITTMFAAFLGTSIATIQPNCPGYRASDIQLSSTGLVASLQLAGSACNAYGIDLPELTLRVEYQTDTRLHVLIEDRNQDVYQVPDHILPRPKVSDGGSAATSLLKFNYTTDPFSFAVSRSNGEVLFDTSGSPLIFETQYLNLRTSLRENPYLYGLGEHSDPFRLNTTDYTRTLWTRDAGSLPAGTNLYGAHPIYLEHRGENGTHAVVLVNSNGMDIKINDTNGQYLEYNTLGGVFDLYFVAGPSPIETAEQIAGVVGIPTMVPYSGFGYHNCRYGYRDIYEVAEVVYNHSAAKIPLETMWSDIDYMDLRQVFTLDPQRYPLGLMRELVDYLHAHQQNYVVMVDPAVGTNSTAYKNGHSRAVFVKTANGSDYNGVVWPGVAVFPDWFAPQTQAYWTNQFATFFDKNSGVDIDFLWIDMNEPSNFCDYPCLDPGRYAKDSGNPPTPPPVRNGPTIPLPGFPVDFQPRSAVYQKRQIPISGKKLGLPARELINPPYAIRNAAGSLSNKSLHTDLIHHGGLTQYDTHNLYGTMMSNASRHAMLSRRPGHRPLVITRSTFLGAGAYVAHWLGDNVSSWSHYRLSIAQMLQFASIFQVPMVGSDVCGFNGDTTESLCARWIMLGAFNPFYRNHNNLGGRPQEAYRWPSVTASARYAIDIRYRLIDYIYTAFWQQTQTGKPLLSPLFYHYPNDVETFSIEHQFFFGDALLVSPVVQEDSTTVKLYLPDGIFYDWNNGFNPIEGQGGYVTLEDVGFQTIPLYVRGGNILPTRVQSANTTTELRKQPFHVIVAPNLNGDASGLLYLDEGSMIDQPDTSVIKMGYTSGRFTMSGTYRYVTAVQIETVSILGVVNPPSKVTIDGVGESLFEYNSTEKVIRISCTIPLTRDISFLVT